MSNLTSINRNVYDKEIEESARIYRANIREEKITNLVVIATWIIVAAVMILAIL